VKFARLRCTRFPHRMGAWHVMASEARALCGATPRNTSQHWEWSEEATEGYAYGDSAVEMQGVCFNCRMIEDARRA